MPGKPSFVSASLWHTPQACTLIRTCPASGFGISRSTISKSAPGFGICAAFIGAIANFVVAMTPPKNSQFECWKIFPGDSLTPDLKNNFQLDRGAERKACDAVYQAARALVFSEDLLQQFRSGVSDF